MDSGKCAFANCFPDDCLDTPVFAEHGRGGEEMQIPFARVQMGESFAGSFETFGDPPTINNLPDDFPENHPILLIFDRTTCNARCKERGGYFDKRRQGARSCSYVTTIVQLLKRIRGALIQSRVQVRKFLYRTDGEDGTITFKPPSTTLLWLTNWPDRELAPIIRKYIR